MFQVGRSGLATHEERPTPELRVKENANKDGKLNKIQNDNLYLENRTFSARKNFVKSKSSAKEIDRKVKQHDPQHCHKLFELSMSRPKDPDIPTEKKEKKKVSKSRLLELSSPRRCEKKKDENESKKEPERRKKCLKPKTNKTAELKKESAIQLIDKYKSDQRREEQFKKRRKEIEMEEQKRMSETLAYLKSIDIGNFGVLKKREILRVNEKKWNEWKILKDQELSVREPLLSKIVKKFTGLEQVAIEKEAAAADVDK